MRTFELSDNWIKKALYWANAHYDHISFHQDNQISYPHQGFKQLLAIGAKHIINPTKHHFETLASEFEEKWLFGYFGYDLKNEINGLESLNTDHLGFQNLYFFEPKYLFEIRDNKVEMITGDSSIISEIENHTIESNSTLFKKPSSEFDKEEYVSRVNKLIDHIIEGDFYEINFCQGFFGQYESIDIVDTYLKLNHLSPKPFSCFQKLGDQAIICASPERFLKKEGQKLISQPIKGTRPRGVSKEQDEQLKKELRSDEKELAENMMIVDLVRNDLAKSSLSGSVEVEEMFGIYSFAQVHQMISTITSTLKTDTGIIQAIKNAFPMGSMTGAPKRIVMDTIDHYEKSQRGAFSGAAGYLQPNGDFDLNVLIRSLFLNLKTQAYGFHVGSAITFDAKAESEYEECFVKAKALMALIHQ